MKSATAAIAACAIATVVSITGARAELAQGTSVAFVGGRLLTLGASPTASEAVILVRDGRVVAVGPADTVTVPSGTERVDLGGRFVLPGLISTNWQNRLQRVASN